MSDQPRYNLLGRLAQHRVAANLLMVMVLIAGAFALSRLNTQFFPTFELQSIQVRTVWNGASPEDVETAVTGPLEQQLRTLQAMKTMSSTSATGVSVITLDYDEGTDMVNALDQVEARVATVRNLPADAERPQATRRTRREPIARLLITGPSDLRELRPLVRRLERELLDRGIAHIAVNGLPEEQITVAVPMARLQELHTSLTQIGRQIAAQSQDRPAGMVGRDDVARQLRSLSQKRRALAFNDIVIQAGTDGRRVVLSDIADISRRARDDAVHISYRGKPAVELLAQRDDDSDSLVSARILEQWLDDTRPGLPPGVTLFAFDQNWTLIRDRINLLLKNGLGGLVLVVAILFLFLNGRVAWWVTVGIPISFMATLVILFMIGGSINMISLFALIMALGIIVDDAIVVGEDALTHYQRGEGPLQAAEGGAKRMLGPVFAASLTTVAAFLPLMVVGGTIGNILGDIPIVIICVIIASLIECFLILPGHLRHSFQGAARHRPSGARQRMDQRIDRLRDGLFRPLVTAAVTYRSVTLAAIGAALVLAIGLVAGGRIGFTFFPGIEGNILQANVAFVAGTPETRVATFLQHVEDELTGTDAHFGGDVVHASVVRQGLGQFGDGRSTQRGPQFGSLLVELRPSDQRTVRNEDFIRHWQSNIRHPAGLERFTISARQSGPPGRDLEVRLSNAPPDQLKAAAIALQSALADMPGVSAIEDDMPFGPRQLIFTLTPQGEALGLTADAVSRQLRAAYDGYLAQIFTVDEEELEVRVQLPDAQRHRLSSLEDFALSLPDGGSTPLGTAVTLRDRQGFDVLRHSQAVRTVTVYADVDRRENQADRIRAQLSQTLLPELAARYRLDYSYEGKAADQRDTLTDMRQGAIAALAIIYLVLAWVFSSYSWPLIVMAAIPFGIVGAIVGHYLLGIDLTILSLFGIFGLSGIVVNDSIILVVFFKHLRERGMPLRAAIVEAACQRLRAVLLTSLTTIAGLLPLLFETSLQAQFLIPMATTIAFGLAFSTVLVLFMIPALLSLYGDAAAWLNRRRAAPVTTDIT